jgi:hypothetical protein
MGVTYRTTIAQDGRNTGIPVPDEVVEQLGPGRRAPVVVDVAGYVYRTTLGSMGGRAILSFSAAHRDASGLGGGDEVEVTLEVDTAPRTVEVPADLQAALDAAPAARTAFDALSPSARKAFVTQVEGAEQPETRARRVAATVDKLLAGRTR